MFEPASIFLIFLRLGCSSFGGPIAHLGFFRTEFVERRQWLSEQAFAEIVALAQSLPGPSSSQTGFALGLLRGGLAGGCAAWLGFTAPSALLMLAFAFGYNVFTGTGGQAVLHGLQLVAVAVVAQAVLTMQRSLAHGRRQSLVAVLAAGIVLFTPASLGTVLAIAFGAAAGIALLPDTGAADSSDFFRGSISKRAAIAAAGTFALLLLASLILRQEGISATSLFAKFYCAGALVFGGGHVMLPLLNGVVVSKGWISPQAFISGYGAAQALPGPLFSFAAYLGAAVRPNPHPLLFAIDALLAIFLPGLLLMIAALPLWSTLRERPSVRAALSGVNASVVGVLIAALYRPVWTSTVHSSLDFWIALAAFSLLTRWKLQPWMVVLGVGTFSWLLARLP